MGEKKVVKKFEELCFRDNFMFGKIMEDPELCREVLQCLLGKAIGELAEPEVEKILQYSSDGKPIRMDVYNEESDTGTVYDSEMQNLNNKTVESLMLPKRVRFYQSSIDIDYLDSGKSYKNLPDSYILFICTFDPFKLGLPQYSFIEKCREASDLSLNDGTEKIFYNCKYKGSDLPESLHNLYDYILTGKASDDLTYKLDEAVIEGRKKEAWRTQYMKESIVIQDARDEGYEEGIEQGVLFTLYDLVKKGLLSIKDAAMQANMTEAAFKDGLNKYHA